MGAIQGLLLAQYEVLREHGHTPSEAFNETVEELTQSLGPLFGAKGMDWMYANCSTTAQREGAQGLCIELVDDGAGEAGIAADTENTKRERVRRLWN